MDEEEPEPQPLAPDSYYDRWNAKHGMRPEPQGLPADLKDFLRGLE